MNLYMASTNYIANQNFEEGFGVPASFTEEMAIRQEEENIMQNVNVDSTWYLINVPKPSEFLDVNKKIENQSPFVLEALKSSEFLFYLFNKEQQEYGKMLNERFQESNEESSKECERLIKELHEQQFSTLSKLNSGYALIDLITERCVTHNRGIACALLYKAGIKGSLFEKKEGKGLIIYNARDDIEVIQQRTEYKDERRR